MPASTVVVIGCGCVGAPVACALAEAGTGRIVLVDPEVLSRPNVGRHPLGAANVGRTKAEALAERLCADYPHLVVEHRACPQDAVALNMGPSHRLGMVNQRGPDGAEPAGSHPAPKVPRANSLPIRSGHTPWPGRVRFPTNAFLLGGVDHQPNGASENTIDNLATELTINGFVDHNREVEGPS